MPMSLQWVQPVALQTQTATWGGNELLCFSENAISIMSSVPLNPPGEPPPAQRKSHYLADSSDPTNSRWSIPIEKLLGVNDDIDPNLYFVTHSLKGCQLTSIYKGHISHDV